MALTPGTLEVFEQNHSSLFEAVMQPGRDSFGIPKAVICIYQAKE